MKTYFVRGYGFHENGSKHQFRGLIDVENPNKDTIIDTIVLQFHFSPYRHQKEIIIEQINVL